MRPDGLEESHRFQATRTVFDSKQRGGENDDMVKDEIVDQVQGQ
jgi:hypothetical protein